MANEHRHSWDFDHWVIYEPRQVSPSAEAVYYCAKCKGTRTVIIKPRIPNPDALTDSERYQRKVDRELQKGLYRASWGPEATNAMVAAGIQPVKRQEGEIALPLEEAVL
jgi:hypothetical protein